ncbi:Kinase-like protein [Mycena sanguinolenta]|uniref:Kinase-like protein n=1 Tax=Mycena sanguinolenta TaxID=230812 RepID=A0A8H6X3P3_9AGAR|nr:Kinase-like protein [Mycena sanguinolenta]
MQKDWDSSDQVLSYWALFGNERHPPPEDKCPSMSLADKGHGSQGRLTRTVKRAQMDAFIHQMPGGQTLDITFVKNVLSSTGPILDGSNSVDWQWKKLPSGVSRTMHSEQGCYSYLAWSVYRPAAHAVTAVISELYEPGSVPLELERFSRAQIVHSMKNRGESDIVHLLQNEVDGDGDAAIENIYTVHEVKRARVLSVTEDNLETVNVLEHMCELANCDEGWEFRNKSQNTSKAADKGRLLLLQAMDELILYRVTHFVLSTESHYVLARLSDDSRDFLISRVYPICGSPTQSQDMVELVLFYTHATLNCRKPYETQVPVQRVAIPSFPPWIFQPKLGSLCINDLIIPAKLSDFVGDSRMYLPRKLSLRIDSFSGSASHDGEIVISFARLIFWLFEARAVAKTAYGQAACERLRREVEVYNALRSLQGVVIPTVFGLYRNELDGSVVLITTYGGRSLENFDVLGLNERRMLMSHVIRLHRSGVQHNDIEPRNILKSCRWGLVITDFDLASCDHKCEKTSCVELRHVAQRVGLDLETELAKAELSVITWFTLLLSTLCIFFVCTWFYIGFYIA